MGEDSGLYAFSALSGLVFGAAYIYMTFFSGPKPVEYVPSPQIYVVSCIESPNLVSTLEYLDLCDVVPVIGLERNILRQ